MLKHVKPARMSNTGTSAHHSLNQCRIFISDSHSF